MSATDIQIGGRHYKDMKIQPVDFILANDMGFCEGNVVKYITRWRLKNGVEDLRKAAHYIDLVSNHRPDLEDMRKGNRIIEPKITAHQYITENEISGLEAAVIRWIYFWCHNLQYENLLIAKRQADSLIAEAMSYAQ